MSLSTIYPYVQRGLVEILLLSVGAGLLGTWIVLRGLAFYSHAVAAAAFPGLVLAAGLGFAPLAGALGSGALVALGVGGLSARRRTGYDVADRAGARRRARRSASSSPRTSSTPAPRSTRCCSGACSRSRVRISRWPRRPRSPRCSRTLVLGPRWLAAGFDPSAARAVGVRSRRARPGAARRSSASRRWRRSPPSARCWPPRCSSCPPSPRACGRGASCRWQLATVALAAAEGLAGVWLSVRTNAPPGATIATLAGAVFLVSALWKGHRSRTRIALTALPALRVAVAGLRRRGRARAAARRPRPAGAPARGRRPRPSSATSCARSPATPPRSTRSCRPTATRTNTSRAPTTSRPRPARRSSSSPATSSTTGWRRSSRRPGGSPTELAIAPDHTPYKVGGRGAA